ncbi:unnamed protein product [Closterium sp. Yama58-4]|nr:unnamed protein product [Closterium sp. Yama58-4]
MESAHQQRNHSARILLLTFACHILFSHPTLPFQGVKVSASLRTTTYGVLTSKGTTCLTTLSPALPMLGGAVVTASGEQQCVECTPAKEPPCHHTALLSSAAHHARHAIAASWTCGSSQHS